MGLPQLDITTFTSQLSWLLVIGLIIYLFNRVFFIPRLVKVMEDRQVMIEKFREDSNKMELHIINLKEEIDLLHQKGQQSAMAILNQAFEECQQLLLEAEKNCNKTLNSQILEYDKVMSEKKIALSQNLQPLVQEVKEKLATFIAMQ